MAENFENDNPLGQALNLIVSKLRALGRSMAVSRSNGFCPEREEARSTKQTFTILPGNTEIILARISKLQICSKCYNLNQIQYPFAGFHKNFNCKELMGDK